MKGKELQLKLKRFLDISIGAALLALFMPLFLIVAVAIKLSGPGPIFFRQQRPGLHGKPFTLIKFRTMTEARDAEGKLLPDEQRLTRLGAFLRSTSLDELPQLWNVLKGEMSLVGPRPLLMQYLDRYTPEQARRHEVKPGLTGWAQVNGRNALTWEERFRLDVYYVDHWSLGFDLRILGSTALKVLKREGINEPGQVTMSEFMGIVSHSDGGKCGKTCHYPRSRRTRQSDM
jgi:lipopolysaccharide/colanic/teichoic acid biosynthesis glycosyltransferase